MWIKRQEGYCLKKIAGVQYLLPYGQKVADQKKGIVLNDTGVFLWNELDEPMTQSVLAERLVEQYAQDNEEKLNDEMEELFHAIRHFFLFFAQRQGFFAIHSASILYRDQVWIFSGHSGMGKSTHTNLWKEQFGTEIINGDLNLIGWNIGKQDSSGQNVNKLGSKGHPIVYGMPWCGTSGIASTKSYPLGGIVLLGRSDNDHFELLTNDQKIVRVMQRMISPVWKEEMLNQNLTCAEKLAKQIPIFYFLCTKEPSAAGRMKDAIDQIQSEGEYRIEE